MQVTVPRARCTSALARHDGEELLYVLSGTLNLIFEDETHTLEAKDSAHFDARIPHRLVALGKDDVGNSRRGLRREPRRCWRKLIDSYFLRTRGRVFS